MCYFSPALQGGGWKAFDKRAQFWSQTVPPRWKPEHSVNFLNTFRSLSTHIPGLETCSPNLPALACPRHCQQLIRCWHLRCSFLSSRPFTRSAPQPCCMLPEATSSAFPNSFVHPTLFYIHVYFSLLASEVLPSCLSSCAWEAAPGRPFSHIFSSEQARDEDKGLRWHGRRETNRISGENGKTLHWLLFLAPSFLLQCKEVGLETAQGPLQPELP